MKSVTLAPIHDYSNVKRHFKLKENTAYDHNYCTREFFCKKDTDGKYSILLPDNAHAIIREGRILHHCVGHGGYIEALAEKRCRILFLRSNENLHEQLITIEEQDGIIRQCYGVEDRKNSDIGIEQFIEKYAALRGWGISAVIYSGNPAYCEVFISCKAVAEISSRE